MVISLDEVLRNMGWDNGFHVPVANTENQALENEIERLMLLKGKTTAKLETITEKYDSMEKHLTQLSQEQTENQKLILSEQAHLENQRTKCRMLQAEKEMLNQEYKKLEKEHQQVQSRIEIKKNDVTRSVNKIEKLKTESAWDAEALEAWDDALSKRHIDNEMIKKFCKEDEKKILELESKRCQMQNDCNRKKDEVHKMASDITHFELVLERTSKYYRELRAERATLVRQWQDSVRNLRQRDADITKAHLLVRNLEEAIELKQCSLEDNNYFLEDQKNSNKQLEIEIQEINNKASRLRKHNMILIETVQTYSSEADTLKRALANTAQKLENLRAEKRRTLTRLSDKEKNVYNIEKKIQQLKMRQKEITESSSSAADRANQLEAMVKNLQREKEMLLTDTEVNQSLLFRLAQTLSGLKQKEIDLDNTINSIQLSSTVLRKQITDLNSEVYKQKEIMYDYDYRINFLHSKIMQLSSTNKTDAEKDAIEEKINMLEGQLQELTEVKQLLDKQIQSIEDEMRSMTLRMTADEEILIFLKNKLHNEILLSEGGQKQVVGAKQKCQQRQVEENMLCLKVNQITKSLKKKGTVIFNLKKCKLELSTALREREIEINAQKDILYVKKRNLDEEKGRLKMDITTRLNRIEQFKTRYRVVVDSLEKNEDGKQFTVTDFKIRLAQEKMLLQERGDELDRKIKIAEKEIQAMENTLRIVNMTNETYKQSLESVEDSGGDTEEMNRLKHELSNRTQELYKQKGIQNQYKKVISEKMQLMQEVSNRYGHVEEILLKNEIELNDLRRDAAEREEKISRAKHQLRKLIKTYPNADKLPKIDTLVRTLQDLNRNILQQLTELSSAYIEVGPLITRYFKEHQIVVPSTSRLYLLPSPSSSEKTSRSSDTISEISSVVSSVSSAGSVKSIPSVTISFEATSSKTSQEFRKEPVLKKKTSKVSGSSSSKGSSK